MIETLSKLLNYFELRFDSIITTQTTVSINFLENYEELFISIKSQFHPSDTKVKLDENTLILEGDSDFILDVLTDYFISDLITAILEMNFPFIIKVIRLYYDTNGIDGTIDYNNRMIIIYDTLDSNPMSILTTLIHELGHMFSYLKLSKLGYDQTNTTTIQREIWAYLYGWKFICEYGLKDVVISKELWKSKHNFEINLAKLKLKHRIFEKLI